MFNSLKEISNEYTSAYDVGGSDFVYMLDWLTEEQTRLYEPIDNAAQNAHGDISILDCYIIEGETWLGYLMATEMFYREFKHYYLKYTPYTARYMPCKAREELYYLISHEIAQTNIKNAETEDHRRWWNRFYARSNGYRTQCEWVYDRCVYIDKHADDKQREVQQLITEMEREIVDTKAQLTELANLIGGLSDG